MDSRDQYYQDQDRPAGAQCQISVASGEYGASTGVSSVPLWLSPPVHWVRTRRPVIYRSGPEHWVLCQ